MLEQGSREGGCSGTGGRTSRQARRLAHTPAGSPGRQAGRQGPARCSERSHGDGTCSAAGGLVQCLLHTDLPMAAGTGPERCSSSAAGGRTPAQGPRPRARALPRTHARPPPRLPPVRSTPIPARPTGKARRGVPCFILSPGAGAEDGQGKPRPRPTRQLAPTPGRQGLAAGWRGSREGSCSAAGGRTSRRAAGRQTRSSSSGPAPWGGAGGEGWCVILFLMEVQGVQGL